MSLSVPRAGGARGRPIGGVSQPGRNRMMTEEGLYEATTRLTREPFTDSPFRGLTNLGVYNDLIQSCYHLLDNLVIIC